jgi:hypothetical protein
VTELELRRDRLVQERRLRSDYQPSSTRASLDLIDSEMRDLEQLNDKFTAKLKRWSTVCGCIWFIVITLSTGWHAAYVWWPGQYKFAEEPCEKWDSVDSNLLQMRIYCESTVRLRGLEYELSGPERPVPSQLSSRRRLASLSPSPRASLRSSRRT